MLNPSHPNSLAAISHRLVQLLKESDNPHAEMLAFEQRLSEEGLSNWSVPPKTSPEEFALNVLEENPLVREHLEGLRNEFRLSQIESPGQLLSHLLPAINDHE